MGADTPFGMGGQFLGIGGVHSCRRGPQSSRNNLPLKIQSPIFSVITQSNQIIAQTSFINTLRTANFPEELIQSTQRFLLGSRHVTSDVKISIKQDGITTEIYLIGFKRLQNNKIQLVLKSLKGEAKWNALVQIHYTCWATHKCGNYQGSQTVNRSLQLHQTESVKSNLKTLSDEKARQIQTSMKNQLR